MRMPLFLFLTLLLAACQRDFPVNPDAVEVYALVETTPVQSSLDAADDPAIWIHPVDVTRSLVLGTDKRNGLAVYNLQGQLVQFLDRGRLNNVDLRSNISVGNALVTLVVATNRTEDALDIFGISADGVVEHLLAQPVTLDDPYGVCMQRNAAGQAIVFANSTDGQYQQWLLNPDGALAPRLLGSFKLDSQPEGCTVDDVSSVLYMGEEDRGIWVMPADYAQAEQRSLLDSVLSGQIVDDVEGMDVYRRNDELYLIVSSQGDHSFALYDLAQDNRYLGSVRIADNPANGVDGAEETDGLAVTAVAVDARFPDGLLVVQDGYNLNPQENQNFKLLSWREVLQAAKQATAGR